MKIRDPKTGRVFETFRSAVDKYCYGKCCDNCGFWKHSQSTSCDDWANDHTAEAVQLMGFEIIEEDPMEENKKPLSDWTLVEVQAECRACSGACHLCRFFVDCEKCLFDSDCPGKWDLEDKPRWTEEDVEDAKAILRVFRKRNFTWVARQEDGPVWSFSAEPTLTGGVFRSGANGLRISKTLIPSLRPGEKARLGDIIGTTT